MAKIGIFSGTFDPVHSGHVAFALEALRSAKLDKVYFIPEPLPRRKDGVTHYAHRLKMLELAIRPYQRLYTLELPDKQFSVSKTMPRLKKIFNGDELYMLIGSDILAMFCSEDINSQWPGINLMLNEFTLLTGIRDVDNKEGLIKIMSALQPKGRVLDTAHSYVSSSDVRSSIMRGKEHVGMLLSIKEYINQNWLYVSVEPKRS